MIDFDEFDFDDFDVSEVIDFDETSVSVIGNMVAIKLRGGITLYVCGKVDGSHFAQKGTEFEFLDFPKNTSLADMIRQANEWGMPF